MNLNELRKYAKEITVECERRGYSSGEVELLPSVLKDEISQCKECVENKPFKALAPI